MNFSYKAIGKDGIQIDGKIGASNKQVAIKLIQDKGLVVVSIEQVKVKNFLDIEIGTGVKKRDLVIITRQLAVLFESDISAHRVFDLVSDQTAKNALRRAMKQVAKDIQEGVSISQAMSRHSKFFDSFFVNILAVGEETGTIAQSFSYLADHMDRSYETTRKVKKALTYPIFVVFMFIGVITVILTFVIPQIETILVGSGQELPGITRFVLGISDFLINHGLFLLIIVISLAIFLFQYSRTETGLYNMHKTLNGTPVLGDLFIKLAMSRFSDNLQTMLKSGVPVVKSLNNVSAVVNNKVYERIIVEAAEDVKKGQPLSASLSRHKEIPNVVVQMIKVGEESGKLSSILKTLASFYIKEVNSAVDTIISLIEPALIILLGVGVGFIISAVLLPIYSISTAI